MKNSTLDPQDSFRIGPFEIAALAVWLVSRLLIAYQWEPFISDLLVYHHSAVQSLDPARQAYRDYFCPYPPAALLFMNFPALFGKSIETYRAVYHTVFLFLEAGMLWLVLRSARLDFQLPSRGRAAVIACITLAGVLTGHLLYDRLDLLLALAALLSVEIFRGGNERLRLLNWNFFFLVKLLPVFWSPWTLTCEKPRAEESDPQKASRLPFWIESLLRLGIYFTPAALVLIYFAFRSHGGLIKSMGEHGERTVQIEATWASLLYLPKLLGIGPVQTVHKWGAMHIDPVSIPKVIDFASRWIGWAGLITFYSWVLTSGREFFGKVSDLTRRTLHAQGILVILLWLMVSQRVLSPQFLIWVAPLLCLFIVKSGSYLLGAMGLSMYALTYWGFDMRYGQMMGGEPFTIWIFWFRNFALVGVFIWLARDLARQLSCDKKEA